MTRARRLLAYAVAVILVAPPAASAGSHAPTIWERVADPLAAPHDKAHHAVEALLMEADRLHWHTPMAKEKLVVALHILEGVNAQAARDLRLRFDLGGVLYHLGEDAKAVPVLERALADAPDHPGAIEAYYWLAISYARLGRPKDEIAMYDEYLRRQTDPVARAYALSNRGEASFLQADFVGAIKDYRSSIELVPDNALTHWSLAVALDRTGDPAGALAEAKLAINYDRFDSKLHSNDVFFMPPYDLCWYDALGAIARAQQIDDPATALLWWETAVAKWAEFIAVAKPDDRWIPLAKAHQVACERELREMRRRAARSTKAKR